MTHELVRNIGIAQTRAKKGVCLTSWVSECRLVPRAQVPTLGRAETRASEASRSRRGATKSRLSSSSPRSRSPHSCRAPNARRTNDRVDALFRSLSHRALAASMTAEGHLGKSPLLGDDDAKHAGLGSSEIPRISWRRAIGVFHLYLAWLIAELIALYVPSRARRPAPSADARATHRGLSSSGASRFFSPAAPPLFSPLTSLARLPSLHSTRAPTTLHDSARSAPSV